MKSILIHFGTHKTGSTSLQQFCARAADQLKDDGILYPKSGRADALPWGHHVLAWSVQKERGFVDLEGWEEVAAEIRESSASKVLISSEGFSRCSRLQVERIKSLLPNVKIKGVVYLRNPIEYMISLYKQHITGKSETRSFESFAKDMICKCDYPAMVKRWERGLGQSVIVRSFNESVERGRLESDFLQVLGVTLEDYEAYITEPANISLSSERLAAVRWVNRLQKQGWMPSEFLHRVKRNVLRGTWRGRCFARMVQVVHQKELCPREDIHWLEDRVSEESRRLAAGGTRGGPTS